MCVFPLGKSVRFLKICALGKRAIFCIMLKMCCLTLFPRGKQCHQKREQPDQLIRHEKRPLPGLWYRFRMNLNWYEVIVKNFTNL